MKYKEDVGQSRTEALKLALLENPMEKIVRIQRTHITSLLRLVEEFNYLRRENNQLRERILELESAERATEIAKERNKLRAQVRYYQKNYGQKRHEQFKAKS